MRKKPVILEEFSIWLRGRFSLTGEEKTWMLLLLIIVWIGLLGRHLQTQTYKPKIIPEEILFGDAP